MIVHLFGGTQPHAGAVAVGTPSAQQELPEDNVTVSFFTRVGHKDDALAKKAACDLAKALCKVVVVIAGFHIDQASKEQIRQVLDNCQQLIIQIINHYQKP